MPTSQNDMREISRALARIEGTVDFLGEAIKEDRDEAREHRDRIQSKLLTIEETVGIVGQVAAQARDHAVSVKKMVDEDIKPQIDDLKRMRAFGKGALMAVGIAATGLGVTAATLWDGTVESIRNILHIT